MPRTLEERITEELDELYRGALFLCAGHAASAEALLVEMVDQAGSAPQAALPVGGDDPADPSLEHLLSRVFLTGSRAGSWAPRRALPRPTGPGRPDAFLSAAGTVPPGARVALWLVVVQRRSYVEAARQIGVDVQTLHRLLEHREGFAVAAGDPVGLERAGEGA